MGPVFRHCPCLRPAREEVKVLDYSHCSLEEVPGEVFTYERTLEELYLSANQIRDLPRALFHCHGLRRLVLSDNEIEMMPPAVASLISLQELDVSKNNLVEIPDTIKGCKCLSVVDISVNPVGKLPEGFTQLINIEQLYLNDTFLEYLPANFGRLSKLKILELRENNLKLLPKSMARLTELCRLDIGQNDFSELPEVIGSLPSLTELWCDSNRMSCLPLFIGNLIRLTYLDASKNKITYIADEIENLTSLADFTLTSNKLQKLPETIGCLERLTTLRLDDNLLATLPTSIGQLVLLEELVVNRNQIDSLPSSIGLLRNLTTLIADDNLLEDLPPEIGSCTKLRVLSLRDNRLSVVPDEIGHINSLRVINLSGNLLRYLPVSIAKLTSIQALWLSENQTKPLVLLQSDLDSETGQRVLTCFLLPQESQDDKIAREQTARDERETPGERRGTITFAFDIDMDHPGKLVRSPTPYPKELKARARHVRNLSKQMNGTVPGGKDAVVVTQPSSQGHHPDSLMERANASEVKVKVREARVAKSPSSFEHSAAYKHEAPAPVEFMQNEQQELELESAQEIPEVSSADQLVYPESSTDVSFSEALDLQPFASLSAAQTNQMGPSFQECNSETLLPHVNYLPTRQASPHNQISKFQHKLIPEENERGYRSDQETYTNPRNASLSQHDGYSSDWDAVVHRKIYHPKSAYPDAESLRQFPDIPLDVIQPSRLHIQDMRNNARFSVQMEPRCAPKVARSSPLSSPRLVSKNEPGSPRQRYSVYYAPSNHRHSPSASPHNVVEILRPCPEGCEAPAQWNTYNPYNPYPDLRTSKEGYSLPVARQPATWNSPQQLTQESNNQKTYLRSSQSSSSLASTYPPSDQTSSRVSSSRPSSFSSLNSVSPDGAKATICDALLEKPPSLPPKPLLNHLSTQVTPPVPPPKPDFLRISSSREQDAHSKQQWIFGSHRNACVFPTVIRRNPELGFSVDHYTMPSKQGIYISHVEPNDGTQYDLKVGDKILLIDGIDVSAADLKLAMELLNSAGPTVSLLVSRNKD